MIHMKKTINSVICFSICLSLIFSFIGFKSITKADAATSNNWAWPTSIHSIQGDWPTYSSGKYHGGTDFPVSLNSPVYSTCDGEVVAVTSLTTSYGKHIKIRATVNGQTVYMRYCHLNGFNVSVGDRVSAGQQIAISGSTGNSTGPHLHYEVRNANDYYGSASSPNLNPRDYLPGTSNTFETWGDNNFPGEEDTSWNVPTNVYANRWLETYDDWGNVESDRHIDEGDYCYVERVYKSGYVWVRYPSTASSDGYRWAYARADGFSLEPKGNNPIGHVDNVSGEVGMVHVSGWAFDSDDIGAQLNIHVYIGGACGDSNAEGHGGVWANVERTDVNNAYGCGNYHGFDANIQTSKTGSQPVYIYAINVGSGTDNPCIGSGTVNITADTEKPEISEVTVSQISDKGYRVSCKVTDKSGISHVSMPTWTHKDGQDDIIWHDATISGDYASFYVSINDHNDSCSQ